MPTTEGKPTKTESIHPKAPDTLNKFIADIGNVFDKKSGTSYIEDSENSDDWKRNEAGLVLSYLCNSDLRENISKQLDAHKDPNLIDPKDVFGNLAQLKTFIFILASDPHKHYNLSYYHEKLKDLSNFAVRAYKFMDNVFNLMQTLVKLIDFSKFHANLYVSIDKFLLIGYDKDRNELTFDINIKKFNSLLHVRESNSIGLGLQNFDSVIYYRECELPKEVEGSKLFLGDKVTNMATLFGLSR